MGESTYHKSTLATVLTIQRNPFSNRTINVSIHSEAIDRFISPHNSSTPCSKKKEATFIFWIAPWNIGRF